jgi:serine/arginine repetitive matrix protein 1
MANIRQHERGERGRGRGRGDRRSSDHDRRQLRYSQSPPPRRRESPERPSHRDPPQRSRVTDTYIPSEHRGRHGDQRRRSPNRKLSASGSRTRSPSPARRRRYSPNRSSPPVRRKSHGRGKETFDRGDDHAKTLPPLETSRSRSPRRNHKERMRSNIYSPSPNRGSGHRHQRHGNTSSSMSRSSSRSPSRQRKRLDNARRSPSYVTDDEKKVEYRTDYRKGRRSHDDWRRNPRRSRSSVHTRQPAPGELSHSISPDRRRDRKRHRSIERYAPAARRRRNTSSVSSPVDKRRKTTDSIEEEKSTQGVSSDERPAILVRGHDEVGNGA